MGFKKMNNKCGLTTAFLYGSKYCVHGYQMLLEPLGEGLLQRTFSKSISSPKMEDLVAIESAAASTQDFQFGLYNNYFPR